MWTWYTQRCIQFDRIIKMSTASSLKNESTVKSSGPDASSKTNPKTPEKNERYHWVWCFTNVAVKLTLINVKFSYLIIYHSLHLLVFVKIHFLCYENNECIPNIVFDSPSPSQQSLHMSILIFTFFFLQTIFLQHVFWLVTAFAGCIQLSLKIIDA